ncbi:MAG: Ig-like domain-containing protein, partial [Clostridia bacterium]
VPATTQYFIAYTPADRITATGLTADGYATKGASVKLEVAEAYRPWFTGWTITPAIPAVDLKGLTITFTADKVYTVTATFAAPLKVTPAVATVEVGKTVQLAAAKDGAAVAATWVSGTPTIATVDASGLVTGVADGSATITATFGGESATCVVTVGKAIAPTPGPTPGPTPN